MRPNTMSRAQRNAVLLVSLVLISAGFSLAQETVVEGIVLDRDGQPLKDVKIVFVESDGGLKFTAKSDKKGKFMRVGMPTGRYVVTAELEGYLPLETDFVLKFERQGEAQA